MTPTHGDRASPPQEAGDASASTRDARVWAGPAEHPVIVSAITQAGGIPQASVGDANVIVWCTEDYEDSSQRLLGDVIHPGIEWVQLDGAGVEDWFRLGVIDEARVWTRADYGASVAEQVVGFLLAACRRYPYYARATAWDDSGGVNLAGKTVGFLGAGRIVAESVERLKPFDVRILTVSDPVGRIDGVDEAVGLERLPEVLRASDHVVIAMPLTDLTEGLIGPEALAEMRPTAWLHNVGRGRIVDTDALVDALSHHRIAGACLDTTDPEPIPAGHPLWELGNVLLTHHTGNPPADSVSMYAGHVGRNVKRFREGAALVGVINVHEGY